MSRKKASLPVDWPPLRSLTRAEVRDIDRRAIEGIGIPGIVLMENAGRGAAELLVSLGVEGRVAICAGKGNNGGDGFVIARHLENRGYAVQVLLFADPQGLRGDAATNYGILRAGGTPMLVVDADADSGNWARQLRDCAWIADALLGTGTQGAIRDPMLSHIQRINDAGRPVLAIDLPSGLDCDTGHPLGACVRASHTATFVARKRGFDTPSVEQWTGEVHVIDIGVPRRLLSPFIAGPAS